MVLHYGFIKFNQLNQNPVKLLFILKIAKKELNSNSSDAILMRKYGSKPAVKQNERVTGRERKRKRLADPESYLKTVQKFEKERDSKLVRAKPNNAPTNFFEKDNLNQPTKY